MRRSWLLGSVSAFALACPISVNAADYPVKAMPRPAVVYSWTGPYAGLNAGIGWGDWDASSNFPMFVTGSPTYPSSLTTILGPGAQAACSSNIPQFCTASPNVFGPFGGIQFGYNFQTGGWVWGVETDIQASGISGTLSGVLRTLNSSDCRSGGPFVSPGFPNCQFTMLNEWSLPWFGTVRGRIGFATAAFGFPNILFYGTGGLAYGEAKSSFTFTQNNFPVNTTARCAGLPGGVGAGSTCPAGFSFSDSVIKAGWTAGGGFEAALDRVWSFKVEYLYMDLGSHSLTATSPYCGTNANCHTITETYKIRENLVRLGLNMRFGG